MCHSSGSFGMGRFFYLLGVALQVLVIGEGLFFAIVTLYAMHADARVFRYAGF
jgi:hypothetical protein